MKMTSFVGRSSKELVARIKSELGPDAVVVNVRKAGSDKGRNGLLEGPIEVIAYRPDGSTPTATNRGHVERSGPVAPTQPDANRGVSHRFGYSSHLVAHGRSGEFGSGTEATRQWRIPSILESAGVSERHACRILDALRVEHGMDAPDSMDQEIEYAKACLRGLWKPAAPLVDSDSRPHVFVGAPGVGKTTCIAKWLTQRVLQDSKPVKVWRVDGDLANTAEFLSIYCEILGVAVKRSWSQSAHHSTGALSVVDIPGVDWNDPDAVKRYGEFLEQLGVCRLHLVLNGAYETSLLTAQARTFGHLPIEDLVITHLDEEIRWAKLWNLVFETGLPIRFLSAGQEVPGFFNGAHPDHLLFYGNLW